MLRSRDEWGEQTKRYYHRGLPPAERDRWAIQTRGGIAKRHGGRRLHARATRRGVTLYRPDEIAVTRLVRRAGPEVARSNKPELVSSVISQAYDRLVAPTMLRRSPIVATPAEPALRGRVVEKPAGVADRSSGSPLGERSSERGLQKFSAISESESAAWVDRMMAIKLRRDRAGP